MNNIENMSDIRQDLCDLPLRKPRTKEGQSASYIYIYASVLEPFETLARLGLGGR